MAVSLQCHNNISLLGPAGVTIFFCAFKFFCPWLLRKPFNHLFEWLRHKPVSFRSSGEVLSFITSTRFRLMMEIQKVQVVWRLRAGVARCVALRHACFGRLFFSSSRSADPSVNLFAVLLAVESLMDVHLHHLFFSQVWFSLNSVDCKSRVYFLFF